METICVEPAAGTGEYNSWYLPGKGLRILVHPDAMDRLNAGALESARRGRTETGGILTGRMVPDADTPSAVIEDFIYVKLASPGGLYQPGDADRKEFRRTLAELQDGERRPLGYFRTDAREGGSLDSFDTALIEDCFPEPDAIFVTLHAYEVGICLAAFFFREDGRIQPFSDCETAFVQQKPAATPEPERPAEVAAAVPEEEPAPPEPPAREATIELFRTLQSETAVEPSPRGRIPRPPRRVAVIAASLAGAALIWGLAGIWGGPKGPLGLRLVPGNKGQLLLSWN